MDPLSPGAGLGFEQTVDLLSNTLPARALQSVVEKLSEADRHRLNALDVNDRTIATLLDETLRRYIMTRAAVQDLLSGDDADVESTADVYQRVDPKLRGEGNPFLQPVAALVRRMLQEAENPPAA